MDKLLLNPEECGELLGVGRTYIYSVIRDGSLASIKLGKRRLITPAALEAFIKRHEDASA